MELQYFSLLNILGFIDRLFGENESDRGTKVNRNFVLKNWYELFKKCSSKSHGVRRFFVKQLSGYKRKVQFTRQLYSHKTEV
jgi:hypothetical protein